MLVSAVKGNNLVAKDIEARRDRRRDLDKPRVVVGDERIGGPCAWSARSPRALDQAELINLEELKRVLVNAFAAGAAVGEIIDNRTLVGFGPSVPLDENALSGSYNRMSLGVGCALVADDVRGSKRLWADKAIVRVAGSPARNSWGVLLVREDIRKKAAV